ncbi:sterol O-acyltransferase 1-like [Argiope bruennichi]|uniref:sterol O-acyltransferase 1-like n=1 Tax=Argiope bruennichi TaxID=94029 RepID=UPI002493DD35|nr:sterol O-acyltransferase 1-like [Argiope bruennichi]
MSNRVEIRKKARDIELWELRQMLQDPSIDILNDVDAKFEKDPDRIITELELKHKKPQNDFMNKLSLPKGSEAPRELRRKEFVLRNSTLTNLWRSPNVRSLYNLILAFFVFLYLHIAIFYYFNVERLKRDLALVSWSFGQFHIVTAVWIGINLSIVFFLHPVFRFWASSRAFAKKKGLYDLMFCTLFVLYEAALLIIPPKIIIDCNIPPASSCALVMEQFRLFMKSYAFVRENINRVLKYKLHQDDDEESNSPPCLEVGKLIYFLFAPTLIYRDSYPRTSGIRWGFVAWNLLQLFLIVLGDYIVYICFLANSFNKAGIEPIPITHFVCLMAIAIFAGSMISFVTFYPILHCLPNAFAEMLRFGDRLFYEDWWNCTSYTKFYRSWNILVHDWLYFYIYCDMYAILKSRTVAMLSVFLLSAIVHEYIVAVSLRFIFPPLFTLFYIAGIIFIFMTRRRTSNFWNFFLWFTLLLGYGLLLVFYSLKMSARINCPRILVGFSSFNLV